MAESLWISVPADDDPRFVELGAITGLDGLVVAVRLWRWAARHYPDGDLSRAKPAVLAITVGAKDPAVLLAALVESGLLDGQMRLVGWDKVFRLSVSRARDAARQAARRTKQNDDSECHSDITRNAVSVSVSDPDPDQIRDIDSDPCDVTRTSVGCHSDIQNTRSEKPIAPVRDDRLRVPAEWWSREPDVLPLARRVVRGMDAEEVLELPDPDKPSQTLGQRIQAACAGRSPAWVATEWASLWPKASAALVGPMTRPWVEISRRFGWMQESAARAERSQRPPWQPAPADPADDLAHWREIKARQDAEAARRAEAAEPEIGDLDF
jgi:hypothetical protein